MYNVQCITYTIYKYTDLIVDSVIWCTYNDILVICDDISFRTSSHMSRQSHCCPVGINKNDNNDVYFIRIVFLFIIFISCQYEY